MSLFQVVLDGEKRCSIDDSSHPKSKRKSKKSAKSSQSHSHAEATTIVIAKEEEKETQNQHQNQNQKPSRNSFAPIDPSDAWVLRTFVVFLPKPRPKEKCSRIQKNARQAGEILAMNHCREQGPLQK